MAARISVEVMAAKAAIHKIGSGDTSSVVNNFLRGVQSEMQEYPPQWPSAYRRTGALGQHWHIQPLSSSEGQCANQSLAYSGRVEGYTSHGAVNQRQIPMFAIRGWQSIEAVAQKLWGTKYRKQAIKELVFREILKL